MKHEEKVISAAAILVTIASLFAAICWITSGKASGEASDRKTAALGFMMLRLESSTEASTARTEQQTYFTQAAMYYAYAQIATDNENKAILENLGNLSYSMSEFKRLVAENSENRAQSYYDAYEKAIDLATTSAKVADYRSTGALIFNISAIVASCGVLLKRKELLYVFLPIFAIGAYYLIISLF